MNYRITIIAQDATVLKAMRRHCEDYFARRGDQCVIAQMADPQEMLCQDGEQDLWLVHLPETGGICLPQGIQVLAELRRRGARTALAFMAASPVWACQAYQLDALQYFLLPLQYDRVAALLSRIVEPLYGPACLVSTAGGQRVLAFSNIEYVECIQHSIHYHLIDGETVSSLTQRTSFVQQTACLRDDPRFIQMHRSYLINLAQVRLVAARHVQMYSGATIPLPPLRRTEVCQALQAWLQRVRYQSKVSFIPQPSPIDPIVLDIDS